MNLWYCQPILIELARQFQVDDVGVSRIPVLLQAGYAVGIVLISPLGDIVRRRQLLLLLILTSGSLTIGLAITKSLRVFEVLSFLTAVVSITPQVSCDCSMCLAILSTNYPRQVLVPLAADLAPANRRATFISFIMAGLFMGVLLARVLSGIIAQFSSYHNVYWMGVGGQFLLLLVLYFITPDVPVKNEDISYYQIMKSMVKFAVTEPALIQSCLILFFSSSIFGGFWVTLTFLLNGAPYHYTTLIIGLFGLVGMVGICMAPLVGRSVDGLVPWMATLVAILLAIFSQIIQTFGGEISVAPIIIAIILLDVGAQATQVSLTSAIFSIAPEARSRLNSILILWVCYLGQVMGTAVGTKLYTEGGYKLSSGIRVVFGGMELLLLMLRGPHVSRTTWIGWEGGMNFRKKKADEKDDVTEVGISTPDEK
ncbi:MFS DHA1 protein [Rhodocollybia butyracea]|uniref:MFS DHA1 protein n=1 Tax=Rhodocollybia butyracea TaxID=206335 RepID=A0A9P5PRE1_9AGAR|nr:MFS DHA1 protein [Rhodocollybia butyracea]